MQNLRKPLTCHSLPKTRQLKPVEKTGAGKTIEALPRQAHSEAQQVASPQLPADVRDGHPEEKPKDRTESSKPDTSDESEDPAVLAWLNGRKKKQDVHDGHPAAEQKERDDHNGAGEEGA